MSHNPSPDVYQQLSDYTRNLAVTHSNNQETLELLGYIVENYQNLLFHLKNDDDAKNIIFKLNQAMSEKINITTSVDEFIKRLNTYMHSDEFKNAVIELKDSYRLSSKRYGIATAIVTIAFLLSPLFLVDTELWIMVTGITLLLALAMTFGIQATMKSMSAQHLELGLKNLDDVSIHNQP